MDNDVMWKALADPTRRRILDQLAAGPVSTGDLAERFSNLSRFAIMKHLGVLEQAHLVTHTRAGKRRLNHLNAVPLRQAYERWVSQLENNWAAMSTSIGQLAELEELALKGKPTMVTNMRSVSIHQEHRIAASTGIVWDLLTTRVGDWWRMPYRMFSEESQMTMELHPGGGLVEKKGEAFVFWALVTAAHPRKSVEFDGLSGPVQGRFTFKITEEGNGTLLTIDHNTTEIDNGEPEGYSGGWKHLVTGLKELAEAG